MHPSLHAYIHTCVCSDDTHIWVVRKYNIVLCSRIAPYEWYVGDLSDINRTGCENWPVMSTFINLYDFHSIPQKVKFGVLDRVDADSVWDYRKYEDDLCTFNDSESARKKLMYR